MADRFDETSFALRLAAELARPDDLISVVATSRGARRAVARLFGEPGARRASLTRFEGKRQVAQRTFAPDELASRALDELVRGFDAWSLERATADLHARRTKKGEILASEGKPKTPREVPVDHDRKKERPVGDDAGALLAALGLGTRAGKVLPGRERKFRQMNRFVELAAEAIGELDAKGPIKVLDAGCGAAYLTFGLVHHLRNRRPLDVLGVDVREDVIASARAVQTELGWNELRFRRCAIAEVDEPLDVVLSLHACDTATDEAIARGVTLGARAILVAPCCQHELHHAVRADDLSPLLRHGILRERFADLATDALRALVLRLHGYKTEVVELIDPDATAKNVLIRAIRGGPRDEPAAREQLAAMKKFLGLEAPLAIERLVEAGARPPRAE